MSSPLPMRLAAREGREAAENETPQHAVSCEQLIPCLLCITNPQPPNNRSAGRLAHLRRLHGSLLGAGDGNGRRHAVDQAVGAGNVVLPNARQALGKCLQLAVVAPLLEWVDGGHGRNDRKEPRSRE